MRMVFHVGTGLSTLLLVVCLILWPLSFWHELALSYMGSKTGVFVHSEAGRLSVGVVEVGGYWFAPGWGVKMLAVSPSSPRAEWSYLAWGVGTLHGVERHDYLGVSYWDLRLRLGRTVFIPYFYLINLLVIPPWLWVRRYRRRRAAGFPVEVGGTSG